MLIQNVQFMFCFQVYVRIRDEEWNVYKRYKQFNDIHAAMKKKYPLTGKYEFPPKKSFGKKVCRACIIGKIGHLTMHPKWL